MNFFALSNIFTAVTSLAVGIFVLLKDKHRLIYKIWFMFTFAVFAWGIFGLSIAVCKDPKTALFLWRLSFSLGVVWIPVFFLHFVYEFCSLKSKYFLIAAYALSILCLPLFFSDLFYSDVRLVFNSFYYPIPGSFLCFTYFLVWICCFFYSLVLLAKSFFQSRDHRKRQLQYMFIAISIGAVGGALNYFPVFGVDVYPWGNFAIPFYPLIISYAILKHQLMDIDVVVRRATVFAGIFAFVYGIITAMTVISRELFSNFTGINYWVATIPSVLIITFTLRPLENTLTNITEKYLFQKKYDYRELLRTFTNEVLTILDLQRLTDQTITNLVKIIKLESACIVLFDQELKCYIVVAAYGLKDKGVRFTDSDVLVSYLKQTQQPFIRDKEVDAMDGHSSLKDDFKKVNSVLCLPITHHDELMGALCLGMKKSGEEFTPEDIDILMTLARSEGIAIANAQLFDQLSKTQAEAAQREKMAVIGTLAAGINHEICNPLGIVRGQCEMFLLNLRDGIYSEKSKDDLVKISTEIMNKVIRETDRATAITKRLSGFAKPAKKMDSEEVVIEKETDEVMGLVGHDLKLSNIEFRKEFEPGFPTILADRRQIQEVLFNIIRNAAQAMDKNDGCITLSGVSANGMAIVKIADNGSGIPKDKIGQIFNPFFTTKEPGKGTGLGLFIVRQVVERNHGTIAVDSEDGVGTTFTLTFPATVTAKAIAA